MPAGRFCSLGLTGMALLVIAQLCAGCTIGANVPDIPMIVEDGRGGAFIAQIQKQHLHIARLDGEGKRLWQAPLAGAQTRTAILLTDGSEGVLAVWMDNRAQDGEALYAQRVSAAGELLWTDGGVPIRVAPGRQVLRGAASDGAGGAFVFWRDMDSAPNGLYVQRINAAGTPAFTQNGVLVATTADSGYQEACVVSDGQGGAIMAWQGGPGDAEHPLALSVQRVDSRGLPLWEGNGIVLATGADVTASAFSPRVAPDGAGGAVVAWQDGRQRLHAQRVDVQGRCLWQNVVLSASEVANTSDLLADGQGGFLIAWLESPRSGDSRDHWALRAQKLDLAGVGQWSTSPLALSASTENMHDVGIVADDAGGATVVWRTGTSPSKDGRIRAQRLDAAGNARWPAEGIMIYADTTRYQGFPRIINDGKGGIIAAFLQGNTAQDARVYAQRVGPAGDLLWPRAAVEVFP